MTKSSHVLYGSRRVGRGEKNDIFGRASLLVSCCLSCVAVFSDFIATKRISTDIGLAGDYILSGGMA